MIKLKGIKLILFDFGGVLAEEGYREGLFAIARNNGLEPEQFFHTVTDIIYGCGFVTGTEKESVFWQLVRDQTGITGTDESLRNEILDRFILRPRMMEIVRQLTIQGMRTAILSDQTLWLDELDDKYDFFKEFEAVYNSFHLGKTKRDSATFTETAQKMRVHPSDILFVDDNEGNIARAAQQGMQVHFFTTVDNFSSP